MLQQNEGPPGLCPAVLAVFDVSWPVGHVGLR